MKKIHFIIATLLLTGLMGNTQSINGHWYSRDGTRQYQVSQFNGQWEATLIHSERPGEKEGRLVLSKLRRKKNKYRGIISSADGELKTTVTIRVSRKNNRVMLLKLKRMLIMDVTIRWYRDPLL